MLSVDRDVRPTPASTLRSFHIWGCPRTQFKYSNYTNRKADMRKNLPRNLAARGKQNNVTSKTGKYGGKKRKENSAFRASIDRFGGWRRNPSERKAAAASLLLRPGVIAGRASTLTLCLLPRTTIFSTSFSATVRMRRCCAAPASTPSSLKILVAETGAPKRPGSRKKHSDASRLLGLPGS